MKMAYMSHQGIRFFHDRKTMLKKPSTRGEGRYAQKNPLRQFPTLNKRKNCREQQKRHMEIEGRSQGCGERDIASHRDGQRT